MRINPNALTTLLIAAFVACSAERRVEAPSATGPAAEPRADGAAGPAGEAPGTSPHLQRLVPNMGWSGALDVPVTSFGAAHLAGHLYILGGYHGTPHRYHREAQSSQFVRRPAGGGAWEELPSPGAVQSVVLLGHAGQLYRVGGMEVHNAEGEPPQLHSVNTVAVFDPNAKRWSALPPLPRPRSSHAAAVVGRRLYVVGGWAMSGAMNSGVWDTTLLHLDLANPSSGWTEVPSPVKSRALDLVALGTRLFAIGGMTPERVSNEVHVYDTVGQSWSRGPEFPEGAFGVSAAVLRGQIYASASSGIVYRLSEQASGWQRVEQLMFPRFFHATVGVEDERVLFVGGIAPEAGAGRIRPIEALSFDEAAGTRPNMGQWTIPAPYPAKNRQGLFVRGTQLYVFGGNRSMGQHDFAPENFLDQAYRLDLGALEWHKLPAFPRRRQSMQTVVTQSGRGLAIGGFGIEAGEQRTQAEAFWFDFEGERWLPASWQLPEARTQFGLVEAQQSLWVFGGLEFDASRRAAERFHHPLAVLRLDWDAEARGFVNSEVELPRARRAFAEALLGERYYLVGGMAEGFGLVQECDVFDFKTRSWESISPPRRTRIGAEMVSLEGKLYLIAGRSRQEGDRLQEDKSIEVYDPQTGHWSVWLETIPMEDTHHLRAFALNGRLVLFSSQREDGQIQLAVLHPG